MAGSDVAPALDLAPRLFAPGLEWGAEIAARPERWRFSIPPGLLDPAPLARLSGMDWATLVRSGERLAEAGAHASFFASIAAALTDGPGFAVLERIPVDALSFRESRLLHLLLAREVGRPRPQDATGAYLCDVVDTEQEDDAGDPVAIGRYWNDLPCHTDHAFGREPPRYLAFLCFRAAETGGAVRLASAARLVRRAAAAQGERWTELRRPFPLDIRRQIDAGDPEAMPAAPILDHDVEGPLFRYMRHQIDAAGLSGDACALLDAVEAALAEPATIAELTLWPGEILLVNNRSILHGRGAYRNRTAPSTPRHHLRLWLI